MARTPSLDGHHHDVRGLHDPALHHDACGLGFVARIDGRPSHDIVEQGLTALCNLNHRGAAGADEETGDGAGIIVQLPHAFLQHAAREAGFELPGPGWYGAGSVFAWSDDDEMQRCEDLLSMIAVEEGQRVIGWRDVPVELDAIGRLARRVAPRIRQVFIERRAGDQQAFERKLYLIRRRLHRTIERAFGTDRFYVVSLSSRTIVYKGLLQGTQVGPFYPDLSSPALTSALALVHSRFSTNTAESWALAHPYRYIAHNGEINTLRGNLNWMRAREAQLESELFGHDIPKLHPVIEPKVSDSAAFDNALELLHLGGRSLAQAIMTMVPEAWENDHMLDPDRRAFYHYSGSLMQPWDGPAAIAFTDGRSIGAVLDRNGLRPARYVLTNDGRVVLASEDGVLPVDPADVTERWRLGPGCMMSIDLEHGELRHDRETKAEVVARHPYRQWVFENAVGLSDTEAGSDDLPTRVVEDHDLVLAQRLFGYTHEDLRLLLRPMATAGQEADGSMGTDTPLAVLSEQPRLLFDYFHQLFAQVTNPPIDPLRERLVMSLRVSLGREHNLLIDGPHHARRIVLPGPVLNARELARLQRLRDVSYYTVTLPIVWPAADGAEGLQPAIERVCRAAETAIRNGAAIIVLSDRGADEQHVPIPSLLATAALRHYLVRAGLGAGACIVVETGEAREVHHIATLVAFGAHAVHPYLAFATVSDAARHGGWGDITEHQARAKYVRALNKGLLKVISKMGISTLHSYCGSQLFEIVGLDRDVVERHFTGTTSRLGGMNVLDLGREALDRHHRALHHEGSATVDLDPGGEYQLRSSGPPHLWNEKTVPSLQRAVRQQDYEGYEAFAQAADDDSAARNTLRSLLELRLRPIPLDDVEPASEIVKRFSTGAMSLGALSTEAHETLAVAMNRMGGRSNSGEGGEDPARFEPDENGDLRRSAIKQIASGRFGVSTHYLVNADALQIKVAQGAKPGEGGQLPGHKVSAEIARLRSSTPGVGLISPPPHHDIYSIEDLAQLIFDLNMVNPEADVSVKLVSEAGVGTIAAGVAKAKAAHVSISGYDGGTGAAVQSSIKHAGLPWELGLAETQQVLVDNHLRGRIRVQVDGQLRTGRDVIVGALLGADEFGFSTAPLIAMGCVMMRVCHLNTCPVGVATQDPVLRQRFRGLPEHVVNYFFFVAEEVRRLMADLGVARFDDLIGRADLLVPRTDLGHWKLRGIDFEPVLRVAHAGTSSGMSAAVRHVEQQRPAVDRSFDARVLPRLQSAIDTGEHLTIHEHVSNVDRTIGAMISGDITRRHGIDGLPDDTVHLELEGVAGQSFGAWAAPGLGLHLTGATNDYAGKGLSGGRLVVQSPPDAGYLARSAIITGNVALYGAIAGEAFFNGLAGERFAVRNSGATAVVEGCGDHGCEYMTGGTVIVLGRTGRNFAAGMSGGLAFVYDPDQALGNHCNLDMVGLTELDDADLRHVHALVVRHRELTGSSKAAAILESWETERVHFVKVLPNDLKLVLEARREAAVEDLSPPLLDDMADDDSSEGDRSDRSETNGPVGNIDQTGRA